MNWLKLLNRIFIIASLSIITALAVYIFYNKAGEEGIHITPEERAWLDSRDGQIRIGSDIDYIPMDFINRWGEHDGISEDFFRLIEKKLGIRFKRIKAHSWSELLEMARRGDVDILKCVVESPERAEYLEFTRPYLSIPSVIVSGREIDDESMTLDDLKGKKVALNKGYYIHELVRHHYSGINVITAESNQQLFKMIASGSVEYIITELPTLTYFVRKFGITNLKIAGETGVEYRLSAGGRKGLPVLNRILMKAIESVTDKEKEDITSRWISVQYRRYLYSRGVFIAIIAGFAAVLCVVFIIGVWNKSLHVLVKKKTGEIEKYRDSLEELVDERTKQLRESNRELANALAKVKTLNGLLPICSNCKKIRNDRGYWEQIELYVKEHSEAEFTHSICPDCAAKLYPGLSDKNGRKKI